MSALPAFNAAASMAAPAPGPRPVGRFAETPVVRLLRRVFALLCRTSPEAAAQLSYAVLAHPPQPRERDWQARLGRQARQERLRTPDGAYTWAFAAAAVLAAVGLILNCIVPLTAGKEAPHGK